MNKLSIMYYLPTKKKESIIKHKIEPNIVIKIFDSKNGLQIVKYYFTFNFLNNLQTIINICKHHVLVTQLKHMLIK